MKTVFQALQEPKGTLIPRIGPVRVAARYPAKQTSNGKWMRNVQISDDSGKAQITIWGDPAIQDIPDGSTIQLTTGLKVDEYNGQKKFVANDFSWEGADGMAPKAAPSHAPTATYTAPPAANKMDASEMAIKMAQFTNSYYVALCDQGVDPQIAEKWSSNAPQFAAQWFFGEKSPEFPEDTSGN